MAKKTYITKRRLNRDRDYASIHGALGVDAKFEQDGLYFDATGKLCKADMMKPKKGEEVEAYQQEGQDPQPAAEAPSPETMIEVMVDGTPTMMSIADAAARVGLMTGNVPEPEPESEPANGTFVSVGPDAEGATALEDLGWPDLQRAAKELEIPGKNKAAILENAESAEITHVARLAA